MNKTNMKRDEAIISTTQVVDALHHQGHKVIGNETIDFTAMDALSLYSSVPKKTQRIVVIYLD